ncbi:hypothetical protein BD410DRAFT_809549 [Rickenella mellea]|uniref:DUF6533 domain-containing protein n=1 Tax=Rickenella mellea TaxID=50990 RepID=A0A4Y7PH28_9AGAM|nr:hypothetical protein BD410DRAFT_809549 [Rickenella mellea]
MSYQFGIYPPTISTSRCFSLSAAVVLAYDAILNLPDEREYIWFSKWSVGKALYVTGRYPVVALFLLNEIYSLGYWGTVEYAHSQAYWLGLPVNVITVPVGNDSESLTSAPSCSWQSLLKVKSGLTGHSSIVMVFVRTCFPLQVTLSLRTLAIWGRDWKAAVILGVGATIYNFSILASYILLAIRIPTSVVFCLGGFMV